MVCNRWFILLFFYVPVFFRCEKAFSAYCTASGGCDEYIYQVQVGTINNSTACSMYADYTKAHSTVMETGVGYQISIITAADGEPYAGYEGDQLGIWVDWNGDEDFSDAGEKIYSASGYGFIQTVITPPSGTAPGNKRMRIRLTWMGTLGPCGSTTYGEVEDYSITAVSTLARIHGTKFNDLDADGVYEAGEPGLGGFTIFLDLNNNGYCDDDEPAGVTSPAGEYKFDGLAPGTYIVREIKKSGWKQSFPSGDGKHTITLAAGRLESNVNFGNYKSNNTIIVIDAVEDAYAKSTEPGTSFGSNSAFASGRSTGSINRSFIKFDLSSIPAANQVTSATLILHGGYVSTTAPQLGVYLINDNWNESTLTWNNQPTISAGLAAADTSIADIDVTVWNVAADVDEQYAADRLYSLEIKSTNETLDRSATFWSRDFMTAYLHPKLQIEYEPLFNRATGDFTSPDGVDMLDLLFFIERWLDNCSQTNNFCNSTDINYDTKVDFLDFAAFASLWLETP